MIAIVEGGWGLKETVWKKHKKRLLSKLEQ